LRPDGRLDLLLSNVPSPNGVALSPDERVLYLGVTRGNQVWRVPLLDDGSVSKVSAFFTSYGPSGPDGLAVDIEGRVIVANPGLGVVWVLNHRAEPAVVLRSCAGTSTTNLAFGGLDRIELRQPPRCADPPADRCRDARVDRQSLRAGAGSARRGVGGFVLWL